MATTSGIHSGSFTEGKRALFDLRSDGTLYVKSPNTLSAYPAKLTERLEYWAKTRGHHLFLAQRKGDGGWRKLTYRSALHNARAIAQSLLDRKLTPENPVMILSGNSIEHALFALGCLCAGIPYAPVSPAYASGQDRFESLCKLWKLLDPRLVFCQDVTPFGKPVLELMHDSAQAGTEFIAVERSDVLATLALEDLLSVTPGNALDLAEAQINSTTVAKIMFTSGSTGSPKGVITTHGMLCSNQEMILTAMPDFAGQPPIVCDWLPWSHVFGGSHNFGFVLYNGGSLFIDEGKPTADHFEETKANLRDVPTTAYFNVPKGYAMLVAALKTDAELRRTFFLDLKVCFCAGAAMGQNVWDELRTIAAESGGGEVLFLSALGSTESGPMALATGKEGASAGLVGLPVPGVELKLVPHGSDFEARYRGPNITPGFWRAPERTEAAFDEEGFYKSGDAVQFLDSSDRSKGLVFAGRIAEDFKLSSGTWVRVEPLRAKLLDAFNEIVSDVLIIAPNRDYIGAVLFPAPGVVLEDQRLSLQHALQTLAVRHTSSSTRVRRALLLESAPLPRGFEFTDKGTIRKDGKCSLQSKWVDELYAGSARVLEVQV